MNDASTRLAFALARAAQQRLHARRQAALRRAPKRRCRDTPVRPSPTQRAGAGYEAQALRLLRQAGLALLARNVHCQAGEIDLVMRHGNTLVFVEVRARASARYGGAAASVGPAKQARLIRSATSLLPALVRAHWGGATPPARFDVVAFEADGPRWLVGAFWLR